jgi:F0F1-type ATP synthase alpha subunit
VTFGADREIKEGQTVKATRAIADTPIGRPARSRRDALGNPIDGKGLIQPPNASVSTSRRPGHSAQVGERADGDRPEGDRCADPDRPRPAN